MMEAEVGPLPLIILLVVTIAQRITVLAVAEGMAGITTMAAGEEGHLPLLPPLLRVDSMAYIRPIVLVGMNIGS
jgi:hypothetical protein